MLDDAVVLKADYCGSVCVDNGNGSAGVKAIKSLFIRAVACVVQFQVELFVLLNFTAFNNFDVYVLMSISIFEFNKLVKC